MKKFINPEIEVIEFQADVVFTSDPFGPENELVTELPDGFY